VYFVLILLPMICSMGEVVETRKISEADKMEIAFKLPGQVSRILEWVDTGVCFLLLLDFGIRFHKAKSKLEFMKWGWIDLLASIPNLPMLRAGRLVRVLRIIRLLRAIRASQRVSNIFLRNKVQGGGWHPFLSRFFCSSCFRPLGF